MNKTLKILTVGALALTGSLAFSGCMADDAKITADEKTQIMTTVENSNKFMENVYSTAQEENEILKQQLAEEKFKNATQNALLEEKNKLLEKELEETKANNAAQNEILEEKNAILQDKNDLLEEELEETKANNEIQNSILQEKNDLLEKQLEEERANNKLQNAELLKKEAKEKLLLAYTKYKLNFNGVRNNLTITAEAYGQTAYAKYYVFADGKSIELQQMNSDGFIYYDDDMLTYLVMYDLEDENGPTPTSKEILASGSLYDYHKSHVVSMIGSFLVRDPEYAYSKYLDNIQSVEIKENGNYVVTCMVDETNSSGTYYCGIYCVEITPDGKFVEERGSVDILIIVKIFGGVFKENRTVTRNKIESFGDSEITVNVSGELEVGERLKGVSGVLTRYVDRFAVKLDREGGFDSGIGRDDDLIFLFGCFVRRTEGEA